MMRPSTGTDQPDDVDLLVRHALVLTMDDRSTIIEDGAIAIVGRDIAAVGPDAELAPRARARRTIDAAGAPVHPGLVDGHVHASFHLLRGVHPDDTDEDAVFDAFYVPFLNALTDEDEHVATLLACLEMVRNGTTCFLEAGTALSPDAAAAAASAVGIRAVLGDAFIWDRPSHLAQGTDTSGARTTGPRGVVERATTGLDDALARLGTEVGRNADPDALVTGHICLNGLGTASDALMVEAMRLAQASGVALSMHHAYSPADTEADRRRWGGEPLVHLRELGVLGPTVTLSHANHLGDVEADVVVETGTNLVWAPSASMLWGHGGSIDGRHASLWGRGASIALGSDSANWSNDFDLLRQADLALLTARGRHRQRGVLGAGDVLRMATRGGARAAGLEHRVGSIEPGKRADLVVHTLRRPELIPLTDGLRNVIHSGRSKTISSVIIDGRVILHEGVFEDLDEGAILARAQDAARSLLGRLPTP